MRFPIDAHPYIMLSSVTDKYDLRKAGLFYLDTYPVVTEPQMVVISPEVAAQVTQAHSLPKHNIIREDFGRAVGPRGMVGLEGAEWKDLRTRFNPGFAISNILALVPVIVEEADVFISRLSDIAHVDGFVRSMESMTTEMTIDIIGQAILGTRFRSQSTVNKLVKPLIETSLLSKAPTNFSPERLNLWRMLKLRYNAWLSDREIDAAILERWKVLETSNGAKSSNVVVDTVLAKFMKDRGSSRMDDPEAKDFLNLIRDNVRTFVFAGHDTSSSVLTYAFYELSRHPEILDQVRQEHSDILGSDPFEAGKRFEESPRLVNSLPLTAAIIKEVLRLYAPATSARSGEKGFSVRGIDGRDYPTEGCMVVVFANILSRGEQYYPAPNSFCPQRWLPDTPYKPVPKDAYRPFEKGPRDCIGQALAEVELKILLALTLRRFDFKEAYDELDRRLGRKRPPIDTVEPAGGRAYQVFFTTAKPKDGLPMWVSERTNE